jgi:hypothetical protein
MKTNKLNIAITVILFFIGWQAQGQEYSEFAPVGAEWYYTNTIYDPLEDCNKYRVEKDTLIDGALCKMVIHNSGYTVIFKQDGGKIYYYFNEQFNLIYDYDVQISDEVVFTFKYYHIPIPGGSVSLMPVRCIVNDIQQIEINGKQYKQFFTTIDTNFEDARFYVANHNYNYIEQIGHSHVFMVEIKQAMDAAWHTDELRCYIEDDFHYVTSWWQNYKTPWGENNLPCDYLWFNNGVTELNLSDPISVFPNPVQDELYLLYPEFQNSVLGEIFSITGQSLMKFYIDNQYKSVNIKELPSGIYFFKCQIDNKCIIRKIIKQ